MNRGSAQLLACLLLAAALRAGCVHLQAPPLDPSLPAEGPPTLLPDLARDGAARLAWLPGLGAGGAVGVVAARPFLGVPLTLETLPLLPGIGAQTAREVAAFYALHRAPAAPPPARDR